MNDNNNTAVQNLDDDQVAALMAELHAEAERTGTPVTDGGYSEASQSEGTFVSEDGASNPVTIH